MTSFNVQAMGGEPVQGRAQGSTGPEGPQGATGVVGPQGVQGPMGSGLGPTGPFGPQGVQGVVGPRGPTGPQGVTGPYGVQGATGYQGHTGMQGITGAQGTPGVTGITGVTGPQGPVGLQGPPGVPLAFVPQAFRYYARSFLSPTSADWPVPAAAMHRPDGVRSALDVRTFAATGEAGVGFEQRIPSGAAQISLEMRLRVDDAGAPVESRLHYRELHDDGWRARTLTLMQVAPAAWQDQPRQTIALAAAGFSPGSTYLMELTCAPAADLSLFELLVEFT